MTASVPTSPVLRIDGALLAEPVHEETPRHKAYRYTLAVLRLALGWTFLWAFLDKLFGLGHETPGDASWLNGGSPTEGFLANAATGPFKGVYNDIAGAAWADWLFMVGLAGIGVALTLGVAMRIAAATGALLLVLMWTVVLPPDNNPFMDTHLIEALVLVALALTAAGRTLGFGRWWETLPIVRRYGFLARVTVDPRGCGRTAAGGARAAGGPGRRRPAGRSARPVGCQRGALAPARWRPRTPSGRRPGGWPGWPWTRCRSSTPAAGWSACSPRGTYGGALPPPPAAR